MDNMVGGFSLRFFGVLFFLFGVLLGI